MTKIKAIIQARVGSSRFPKKIMKKIDDKNSVLCYVIKQLEYSKLLDDIIVATTTLNEDDEIVKFAKEVNIKCFRGDAFDVLDRYYKCAKEFSCTGIVRITSDCPLIDPTIVDQAIEKFKSGMFDYVTNKLPLDAPTVPQGTEVEVFSFEALKKTWREAKKPSEREHVTPYIYTNPHKFKIFNIHNDQNLSHLRWTIDTNDDLKLIKQIISKIRNRPILTTDILQIILKEPELMEINKNHILNEGYLQSLKNDKEYFNKNQD